MGTQQAEVAATVHFAAQEAKNRPEGSPTEKDVLDTVMKWKQKRRPPLDEKEVAMTVRNLNAQLDRCQGKHRLADHGRGHFSSLTTAH